jgi:hypothetical protein
VAIGPPIDAASVGFVELICVAVGHRETQPNEATRVDMVTAELGRRRGDSTEYGDRRVVPEELLGRHRDEIGVFSQSLELVGIDGEVVQGVGDHRDSGVAPSGKRQIGESQYLVTGEWSFVEPGTGE